MCAPDPPDFADALNAFLNARADARVRLGMPWPPRIDVLATSPVVGAHSGMGVTTDLIRRSAAASALWPADHELLSLRTCAVRACAEPA